MSYALTANPHHHYYTSLRGKILGIVLHVTAGLEDFTAPFFCAKRIPPARRGVLKSL